MPLQIIAAKAVEGMLTHPHNLEEVAIGLAERPRPVVRLTC